MPPPLRSCSCLDAGRGATGIGLAAVGAEGRMTAGEVRAAVKLREAESMTESTGPPEGKVA